MRFFSFVLITLLVFPLFTASIVNAGVCGDARAEKAYKNGMAAYKEKLYNAARQQFERAVRYDPNCVNAHFQLGRSYMELIPYQDLAIDEFKKVQELVPDSRAPSHVDAVYHEGIAHLKMGAYEEAIKSLNKTLELDPTFKYADRVHNYLGVTYYFFDNYEIAIKEFKRAIQENSTYREANFNLKSVNSRLQHYNIGVTYGFMGNYREAIKELNKAIEIDTNFFDAHLELGRIYIREGMYGDAISELTRCMRINPTHRNMRKVYLNLGIAFYNQGSADLAIENLRKALKIQPEYRDAIKNLRSILIGWDPLEKDKTDIGDKEKYVQVRMDVANDYFMSGLYSKAVALFTEVLDVDFQNKEAADSILRSYDRQGQYYINRKDYTSAIKVFKKLLKITPEDLNIWIKIGEAYFSMPGKYWYKEAEGAFTKAISVEGSRYFLARIYRDQKKYEDAKEEISMAIREDMDKVEYHLLAAKLHMDTEMYEEAREAYKMCLELDPENEDCQSGIRIATRREMERKRGLDRYDEEGEEEEWFEVDYKTLIRRGLSYVDRDNNERAAEMFRQAAEDTPEGIEAHNNLGATLILEKRFDDALVEFMISESLNPKDAGVHINLAIVYYNLEDFINAQKEYVKALRIDKKKFSKGVYTKLSENGSVPPDLFKPKIVWKRPR